MLREAEECLNAVCDKRQERNGAMCRGDEVTDDDYGEITRVGTLSGAR